MNILKICFVFHILFSAVSKILKKKKNDYEGLFQNLMFSLLAFFENEVLSLQYI